MSILSFDKAKALFLGLLTSSILLAEVSCAQPSESDILIAQHNNPSTSGADAKVIAHWNVVPFQSLDAPFNVGVVAFHINGVDRVDFQINGGSVQSTKEMRFNERTKTTEYWITVDPEQLGGEGDAPRAIEISATAYPKTAGIARTLDTLPLLFSPKSTKNDIAVWVSETGSDRAGDGTKANPYRQPGRALEALSKLSGSDLSAGLPIIYLMKGTYEWGSAGRPSPMLDDRWVTISAAPGLKREDVVFSYGEKVKFSPRLLKVTGVTIGGVFFAPASGSKSRLWIDDSDYVGLGVKIGRSLFYRTNWSGVYYTDMNISNVPNGANGVNLVRNVHVRKILSDAFSGSRLVINSSVDGIDRLDTKAHPDVYQIYCGNKDWENFIVYGLTATNAKSQGIFTGGCSTLDNVAIVNTLIVRPLSSNPDTPFYSQWHTPGNHLIFSGLTLPNSLFRIGAKGLRNVLVEGSMFYKLGLPAAKNSTIPLTKGFIIRDVHIVKSRRVRMPSDAIDISSGNPGFENATGGNFTPLPDSVLRNRVKSPVSGVDILGKPRNTPATVGAIE
ncbi:MAG: hypothetical protein NXI13_03365 [Proteobacteria bacterium]|nr:hypothetical protein [Pseudomonadota bacterium]